MSQARCVDTILEREIRENRLTHPEDIETAREVIASHVAQTVAWFAEQTQTEGTHHA